MSISTLSSKARWHGKNRPITQSDSSSEPPGTYARFLERLRHCAQLLQRARLYDEDLCEALLRQTVVYTAFIQDVMSFRANALDPQVRGGVRSVGEFCRLVEAEYGAV